MLYKKLKHYKGLDCSGPVAVHPPVFKGIADLVQRYGGSISRAAEAYPNTDEERSRSTDISSFIAEYQAADKVDRMQMLADYNDFIKGQISASFKKSAKPVAAPAAPVQEDEGGDNGVSAAPSAGAADTP